MTFLGIEIGGTKLQIVLGDEHGTIHQRFRRTVAKELGAGGIRAQIEAVLRDELPKVADKPAAIGVGFGGPVDWATGRIAKSHQIEGWSGFDIAGWLTGLTGLRVHVDNDANVAALGEALHGAGSGADPSFYITMGSGVGGGLVVDGKIFHGAKPGESEIGHVRLDKSGVILEERCSGWAVDRRIREAVALHPHGPLARHATGMSRGEARALAPALAENDPLAQAVLSELADNLAFGLSHVVQLMHPERIVLGGGLSLLGEPLRAAVAAALPRYVMEVFGEGPGVVLAGLGEDAVPVGCLALVATRTGG
jgi:glucokinase